MLDRVAVGLHAEKQLAGLRKQHLPLDSAVNKDWWLLLYDDCQLAMSAQDEQRGSARAHSSHWLKTFVCVSSSQSAAETDAWTPHGWENVGRAEQM